MTSKIRKVLQSFLPKVDHVEHKGHISFWFLLLHLVAKRYVTLIFMNGLNSTQSSQVGELTDFGMFRTHSLEVDQLTTNDE